jgi:8-oxo-dGTP pyrophosphatase MutT (NUDIX family)
MSEVETKEVKKTKKTSIGVALCRRRNGKTQILLVKSRLTYSYNEFVFGKYKFNDQTYLQDLFNKMTVPEKLLLLSMDFNKIWYHIWLKIPKLEETEKIDTMYQFYTNCRTKYEKLISRDNGHRLKTLIKNSKSPGDTGWGLPRGRPDPGEKEIDCGLRELWEEGNIPSSMVQILNLKPIATTYNTPTCIYLVKFYVGTTDVEVPEGVNFNNHHQSQEICDTRWVTISEIDRLTCQTSDGTPGIQNFQTMSDGQVRQQRFKK